MKKRLYFLLFLFILIGCICCGETGYVYGRILKENSCIHDGIVVKIYNEKSKLISTRETVNTGDYYFKNIADGKYRIEVADGDKIKSIEFIKKTKNIEIKKIMTKVTKKDFLLYSFTYLLYLIGITANIIIFYFLKKGFEIKGKKYIYYSIYLFTFTFIFNIISVLIGFTDENIISYFSPITNLAGIFAVIPLTIFFMNYPVKRKNKIIRYIIKFAISISFIVGVAELVKIYTRTIYIYIYTTEISKTVYRIVYILWDIEIILLISLTLTVLALNYFQNKNRVEGEISKFCLKIGTVVFLLFLFGSCIINRVWDIPFENYIDMFYVIIDIIVFSGVLIGVFGVRFIEKYRKAGKIFNESIKISILFAIYFALKHYNFIENMYALPIFFICKYLMDYFIEIYLKRNIISKESSVRKIEKAINYEMIEREIAEVIEEKLKIKEYRIKTILNGYSDREETGYFEGLSGQIILIDKNIKYEEYKKYKIIVKMQFEGKINGIILLGDKINGKFINRNEIDFLIDLAEEGAYAVNGLMTFQNRKEELNGDYESRIFKEREKTREAIEYGRSYADRILQNIENREKIEKYCQNLKEAFEELKREDNYGK